MNDFFYESFLDEIAHTLNKDPFEYRLELLREARRQAALLRAVGEFAGGLAFRPVRSGR